MPTTSGHWEDGGLTELENLVLVCPFHHHRRPTERLCSVQAQYGHPPRMWKVSRDIDAPAETVWQILTDLDAWPRWGLSVTKAELDCSALLLGATGRVWTPVAVPLPFVISEFDPGRMWGWDIAGLPATRHGVETRHGGCQVWMSAPFWAPAYLPVLEVAVRRIEKMAQ